MTRTKKLDGFALIPIEDIHPNPDNPRTRMSDLDDLADSIRVQGILEPLIVMPHPDKPNQYQLLAGHRRLAAAELAGKLEVPCILHKGKTPAQALEFALVENGQRADLDPIDEARAIRALVATGLSKRQTAARIGRSPAHVSARLDLLTLTPSVQQRVKRGELSANKANRLATEKKGTAGSKPWMESWFNARHMLAPSARYQCKHAHNGKHVTLLPGDQACGQYWETVIREHARMAK